VAIVPPSSEDVLKHDARIDAFVSLIDACLKFGGLFYLPVEVGRPLIMGVVQEESDKLKNGLASGDIVSDGHWGYVPGTNSTYDPKTGRFIKKQKAKV
jgi:hypothetical protein